ncbi:hypothetical protein CEP52_011774 [Fusarium oligoseptatum]|uniref:GST C-terminal domain-containing protein n=1 Tax=Fusarium oligoseptatum TaxID=2604345 RepID=A0A428T1P8_9HYPO|nr:hypothetical protein CEP52_011774 [Fusarium oligoseptatum]
MNSSTGPVFQAVANLSVFLFEEANVPYSDIARTPDKAMPTVLGLISTENLGDDHNPPPLAPPMLKHGDLIIHQLPNILLYLAPKLGLAPKEGGAVYHLNQISLTMLDGFLIEIHETHHPIAISLYYEDQKEEAKRRSKYFIKDRLPKYFGYMQRVLEAKTSGQGPWLYGDSLTYVDLVLFQCVDGTAFAFPKSVQALEQSGKYDDVFKLYAEVKARPNIAKYLASDRRQAYGNGIWRRYPELEED